MVFVNGGIAYSDGKLKEKKGEAIKYMA